MTTHDTDLATALLNLDTNRIRELLSRHKNFSKDILNQALIVACNLEHKFVVQKLVGVGADIECRDSRGNTPLLICAKKGLTDILRFLVSENADVTTVNMDGDNAIILSITPSGSTDLLKILLNHKEVDLDIQNQKGYTALMKAIESKDVDILNLVLRKYHDDAEREKKIAGHFTFEERIRKCMNIRGETIDNLANRVGIGPLFYIMQEFILTKSSPLTLAVKQNDVDSLRFLLNSEFLSTGFSPEMNPMHAAFTTMFETIFHEQSECLKLKIPCIEELLKHGACVNSEFIPDFDEALWNETLRINKENAGRNYNVLEGSYYTQPLDRFSLPILEAAKHGCLDVMKLLLQYNADVKSLGKFNYNPLYIVFAHGHHDCLNILKQHGAVIDLDERIFLAIKTGCLDFISQPFFQDCDGLKNYISQSADRLLCHAVAEGTLEVIEYLLENGADINSCHNDTVLPVVVSRSGKVAEFLIKKGADLKTARTSTFGKTTPLCQILHNDQYTYSFTEEVVEVFLKHGASPRKESQCDGQEPLIIATNMENNSGVIKLLLNYGADIMVCDRYCRSVLSHAVEKEQYHTVEFLTQKYKSVTQFINAQDSEGKTALMYSIKYISKNTDTLMTLLENGADVHLTDRNGDSALFYAISNSNEDCVERLIKFRSDINLQNNKGLSPLMLASKKGNMKIIQLLVNSGADVNAVNHQEDEKTAITYVTGSYNHVVVDFLLDKGAHSSYANETHFLHAILNCEEKVNLIPKLLQSGLGPADLQCDHLDDNHHFMKLKFTDLPLFSPIALSLAIGCVRLARFFFSNMFLTPSDVSSLLRERNHGTISQRRIIRECQKFMEDITSQPFSLQLLSFVVVTSAVGSSPGREKRILALPVHESLKNKLLFKDLNVSFII